MSEPTTVIHILGCTRTIATAVLVVEYLKVHCIAQRLSRDGFKYRFKTPCDENGFWSADIVYEGAMGYEASTEAVIICRAFVAGRGEIW